MRRIGRAVKNYQPGPDDPTGIPDTSNQDWDELTLVPPEGQDATRWITVDRDCCIPLEESR